MAVVLALVVAVLVLVVVVRRRSHRRDVHAGIVAGRPTFTVEPPTRRLAPRSSERL